MVSIDLVTVEDMARVLEIEVGSFFPPWTFDAFYDELDRDDSFFAVARDGDVLGFVILRRMGDDGEIINIAVDESARRRGIGDMLVRAALRCADENALESVFLEVRPSNDAAIALYTKHGFKPVRLIKDYYTDPLEDALVMAFGYISAD